MSPRTTPTMPTGMEAFTADRAFELSTQGLLAIDEAPISAEYVFATVGVAVITRAILTGKFAARVRCPAWDGVHAEFVRHGFAVTHEDAHADDAQQFVVTWGKPPSFQ